MASVENKIEPKNEESNVSSELNDIAPEAYHPSQSPYPMRSGSEGNDHLSHSSLSHHKEKMYPRNHHQMPRGTRGGHYDEYHRSREYDSFQQVERREGSSRNEDHRSESSYHYHHYPRDGPSPGRGYVRGNFPPMHEPPRHHYPRGPPEASYHHSHAGPPLPFRSAPPPSSSSSSSTPKRKAEEHSAAGPTLISNQSSDDSINALLPYKRPRQSKNGFSDAVQLMKSFEPLSPIHSRTFSRDDALDMSRIMDSRGSAEGLRIFQSWSSGNSPAQQEDQLSNDIRNCYHDWQGPPSRKSSSRNLKEEEVERKSSGSKTPTMRASSRGQYQRQDSWGTPPPVHPSYGRGPDPYNRPPNSHYTQALHPEDRFGPFNDHLRRRAPSYSQDYDSRYPYEPYPPRRSHDEMSEHSSRRGPPPPPLPPPAAPNGWNGYEDYHSAPSRYDHRSPNYETWSDNRPYAGDSSSYSKKSTAEPQSREYTGRHLQSALIERDGEGIATSMRTASGVLLLSLPDDKISLSETLCIVRENIEVFVATDADVKAPAPGRKRPVVIGQVGLRCIHCRVATHQSEKVKRAVCFPSSIKRIYRTVIDMKLDHFKACRFVPVELKMKLEQLRASNARSTGTTMQYFVQAAKRMGMVDGGHGIRFCKETAASTNSQVLPAPGAPVVKSQDIMVPKNAGDVNKPRAIDRLPSAMSFSLSMDLSLSGASAVSKSGSAASASISATSLKDDIEIFHGKTLLSCPDDKASLSPLRCFLRENVYAFSATAEDIAVRTPTTFSVAVGQVGIGCIHCLHLPAKERSNRAVCFPFSIGRIYQSVADIQRFHISECKMIPPDVKAKFVELQKASTKGSKGLATRQYWVTSAKKRGMVDTSNGIRFGRDPSIPFEKAVSLDILAQVANDVNTASKPLVLPEDEDQIAGFIYLVMKQLQPCRFTEADRNKRRLKDVGCIGVECKHCAGRVDGRKFFWSSVNAVESNFVSVHTHMMECKAIPDDLKEELGRLKALRKEHTAKLKTGSQKSFFARVWNRLHADGNNVPNGEKAPSTADSQVQAVDAPKSPEVNNLSAPLSNVSSPSNSFSEQDKFPLLPLALSASESLQMHSSPSSSPSDLAPEQSEKVDDVIVQDAV